MKQGVRAAVVLMSAGKVLLVRHVDPVTAEEWWVPPGGALEDHDATVFSCAQREAREETGLSVVAGRLIYYREFRDSARDTRWVELYFLGESFTGTLAVDRAAQSRPPERYVREARWFARDDLAQIRVFPEMLRDQLWQDAESGFSHVLYLGVAAG